MSETIRARPVSERSGTPLPARVAPRIPVAALGLSLSGFLALTYVLCVLFDLWFPEQAMRAAWLPLLPGVTWLNAPSFLLGLVEAMAYGWYVALVFAPLFNFFAGKLR